MTNFQQTELFNKLLKVYKQLQWSREIVIGETHYNCCPLCDQVESKGHDESCPCFEMNKVIANAED